LYSFGALLQQMLLSLYVPPSTFDSGNVEEVLTAEEHYDSMVLTKRHPHRVNKPQDISFFARLFGGS